GRAGLQNDGCSRYARRSGSCGQEPETPCTRLRRSGEKARRFQRREPRPTLAPAAQRGWSGSSFLPGSALSFRLSVRIPAGKRPMTAPAHLHHGRAKNQHHYAPPQVDVDVERPLVKRLVAEKTKDG